MKLKLEAISPAEGIGIVRTGKTLRLLRPPYVWSDTPELAENSLRDAILRHGFSACEKQFDSWKDVIEFLNEQVVIVRRALGKEIPDSVSGRDVIAVAPPEILNSFLDRVEAEIIPQRLFDHAENILLAILITGVGARHPEVGVRAATLLQRNKDARNQSEGAISELATNDIRFVNLEKHGELERSSRLAELIRLRGSVFAPVC